MKEGQREESPRHWGSMMFRYRWAVALIWVFFICFLIAFASKAPLLLKENGFTPEGSPSQRGIEVLESKLGMSSASIEIVLESTTGENLTTAAAQRRILDELSTLRSQPFFKDMYTSIVTRRAGHDEVTAVTVLLKESMADSLQNFEEIKKRIPEVSGTRSYITGNMAIYDDMNQAVRHDIARAEAFGIPAALLILLLIFRTVPAAILPLVVGLSSVTVTMGIVYFIAKIGFPLSNLLPNMVTMLGLAVGIDYALFIVSRFREELRGRQVEEALVATCRTAGKSVLFSGIAVLVGLFALYSIRLSVFRSLSIGGMLVVLISMLAANTLLPALLGIIGERIHALPVKFHRSSGQNRANGKGFWVKVARGVMKYPVVTVILVTAALLTAMIPAVHMKLGIPAAEVLPPTYESRYGADLLKKSYETKEMDAIQLAVELVQPFDDPRSIREIQSYMAELRQLPNVNRVESYASLMNESDHVDETLTAEIRKEIASRHVASGNAAVIAVVSEYEDTDTRTTELVKNIRSLQEPEGMKVYVTGTPSYKLDIMKRIAEGLPFVLIFVFGATYVVLFAAFRSLLLPLKAVLMNVLSLGASLGVVVLVFQEGYGARLFQVSYTGDVFAMLPILIFCVVFGISMDYEVIMLSRMMEAYRREGNNEQSTALGLQQTGGMITGAASILIVVVGAFIFTDNEVMKAIGLGLTVSIFIDVTVVRVLLVPALMKLFGKANWWCPRWLSFSKNKGTVEGDAKL